MQTEIKESNRGGKRAGAGRKPKALQLQPVPMPASQLSPPTHEPVPVQVRHTIPTPQEFKRKQAMDMVIKFLSLGLSITTASKQAGIDRISVRRWRDSYPEFAEAVNEALTMGGDHMEDTIVKHSVKDWRAAESWLKANRRDKWGNHVKSEHSGPDGGPIQYIGIEVHAVRPNWTKP